MDLSLTTKGAMECSSNDDELGAMLDCWFDPSDTTADTTFDFLDSKYVDAVEMDIFPLDVAAVESTAESQEDTEATKDEYEPLPVTSAEESLPPSAAAVIAGVHDSFDAGVHDSITAFAKRPRRRSLTMSSPPRSRQRKQQEEQQEAGPLKTSGDVQYNEMLNKLATSMKRSEASRANVLSQRPAYHQQQQQAQIHQRQGGMSPSVAPIPASAANQSAAAAAAAASSAAPQPQSIASLSGFFSGQRTTLTSGLEQSRRQLAAFGMSRQVTRMSSFSFAA